MRTNEHVAGQWSPLFSWPVLVASKTIQIFNVKGDFFFFLRGPSTDQHSLIYSTQHINTAGKQNPEPITLGQTFTRMKLGQRIWDFLKKKKTISRPVLPSFHTFNDCLCNQRPDQFYHRLAANGGPCLTTPYRSVCGSLVVPHPRPPAAMSGLSFTNPFEGNPPRAVCSSSIILPLLSLPPVLPPSCHSVSALGVERWQTGYTRDANLIHSYSDANRADLASQR